MEWLSSIFDLTKLPAKVVAWVSFVTALLLFLPTVALQKVGLDGIPTQYKPYVGVLFLASSVLLLVNVFVWGAGQIGLKVKARIEKNSIVNTLRNLDPSQRALLREFYIQSRHVIELPVDHPTVAGLRLNAVLVLSSVEGYRSLAGSVFPCSLSDVAKGYITPELLQLPRQPTETEVERIRLERPNFVYEIAERDRLRGGVRGLFR